MTEVPYLSLVVPAYNEQENVVELLRRVDCALAELHRPFEVLVIDDGSTDDTPRLLREAMKQFSWLRVLTILQG